MKRILSILLAAASALSLCGCGSIYSNYKEIEQLLVIQTMGLDTQRGGVLLSLASASDRNTGNTARCLTGTGDSITTALDHIYKYSFEEQLFCSHINHVLIGEEAAEQGINSYLEYICRSPVMRLDTPLYIVKNGTAQKAVMDVSDGSKGISEVMDTVEVGARRRGDSGLYTAAHIMRNLERHGSALVCALEYAQPLETTADGLTEGKGGEVTDDGSKEPSGQLTAALSGYAVIRDGKLCKYLDREQSIAAGFLCNNVGISSVQVRDRHGSLVVLEINSGGSNVKPVWESPGVLEGLEISINVQAAVVEINGRSELQNAEYTGHVTAQLESLILDYAAAVMQSCEGLKAEFLCLGDQVETSDPEQFRLMSRSFADLFPELELQISVSGRLTHTNDVRDV